MTARRSDARRRKKKTSVVPRIVIAGAITTVVPSLSACGPGPISLDTGAYDVQAEDRGYISLDVSTYDSTAPDHGIIDAAPDAGPDESIDGPGPDLIISLDTGTFDAGAPDLGFETGPESGSG